MAPPTTVPGLLEAGVLDAELAALCWALLEGGVPLAVTGAVPPAPRTALYEALLVLAGGQLPGSGSAGTYAAASLADLFAELRDRAGYGDDELRTLGLVLVLAEVARGASAPGGELRVVAAHYVRPVERDGQGHLQRRPPAVLATWDVESGAFEHFAWGVAPELAARVGTTPLAFEAERAERRAYLEALCSSGIVEARAVARALAAFRTARATASRMPA
ncbi:MAG: hypothetical protein ACXWQ6_09210 [Candidatus Limnocylindrales bacterium]